MDKTLKKIQELQKQVQQPDFWSEQNQAKAVNQELADLQKEVDTWQALKQQTADLLALAREAEAEGEESLMAELAEQLAGLEKRYQKLEFYVLLNGRYDSHNAILSVHAGTGGTEAQDWAEMLLRMFLRFCEQQGWSVILLDESRGNEAGIKSATIEITGRYAYGHLKSEHGVHRLVRISPFDAEKMRHTSFALVEVLPELPDSEGVEIKPEEIEWEAFRSGGKGGQNVNKVSSAIRLRHLPTGLVVKCQTERSQQQNKESALRLLQAKLNLLAEQKRQAEEAKVRGEYVEGSWGNQIRSYVMQPYQMVKDHRTKYESSNVGAVLDGELLPFMQAYLKWLKQN